MNKKIVLVAIGTVVMALLFTFETALAWSFGYSGKTAADWSRCLGVRCDRTETLVFRTPRFSTPSYSFRYPSFSYGTGWVSPWRQQKTTCYNFVWE